MCKHERLHLIEGTSGTYSCIYCDDEFEIQEEKNGFFENFFK